MKRLDEIFEVYYGNQFDFNKMTTSELSNVNFVSRSGNNLGVVSKVDKLKEIEPFQPGQITVALGGSILSSFVQMSPFYTGQNIKILKPKNQMSFETLVYYALCIEKNKFRYSSHGREANITLNSLLVPDIDDLNTKGLINIDEIVNEVQKPKLELNYELKNVKYSNFNLSDIFDVSGTKTTSIHKLKEYGKGDYPYITTSSKDCGINGFFNFYTEESHVLTIESAVNGVCYYQDKKFSASDHVEKLIPKFQVSKEFMIYVSVLVNSQNFRFNYGRKANQERIKKLIISLPITDNGDINFEYIDLFMGSLKFSSTIV